MKTNVCILAFCSQIANRVISLQNKYSTNSQSTKRRGCQLHKLSKQLLFAAAQFATYTPKKNSRWCITEAVFCRTIH